VEVQFSAHQKTANANHGFAALSNSKKQDSPNNFEIKLGRKQIQLIPSRAEEE